MRLLLMVPEPRGPGGFFFRVATALWRSLLELASAGVQNESSARRFHSAGAPVKIQVGPSASTEPLERAGKGRGQLSLKPASTVDLLPLDADASRSS